MLNAMELASEAQGGPAPAVNLGTILIIEDDPRMQRTLERTFAQERYSALIAGDGQTGLDLFRSEHPLAVVLDLILPNISGRELSGHSSSFQTKHLLSYLARSAKWPTRFFCSN